MVSSHLTSPLLHPSLPTSSLKKASFNPCCLVDIYSIKFRFHQQTSFNEALPGFSIFYLFFFLLSLLTLTHFFVGSHSFTFCLHLTHYMPHFFSSQLFKLLFSLPFIAFPKRMKGQGRGRKKRPRDRHTGNWGRCAFTVKHVWQQNAPCVWCW